MNVIEVTASNDCTNEFYIGDDIIVYGLMIIMISVVGAYFIKRTKELKHGTFQTHKKETIAIFVGAIVSFSVKAVAKLADMLYMPDKMCSFFTEYADSESTMTPDDLLDEIQNLFFYYAICNFFVFLISEFLPITAWTILKNPEDYINQYNDINIPTFSIFQIISNDSPDCKDQFADRDEPDARPSGIIRDDDIDNNSNYDG
eukprot:CAMPEP_0202964898 /NCGR_PEP_ID=MMETSP1396-20130829/9022_1 /ASSEMBLY_ACC=CAM_ASM_000872 /TAXON_ID= /ORGANISM="Pseudokeronopsis sp., Strain Brazil" /LENGTH=201 /DNA_ID=CAMNT_0049687393 /DNA_START=643 /DNA_END=1248 /DNA_ORIENTATION=-